MLVAMDSTPLFLLTFHQGHGQGDACRAWAMGIESRGDSLAVPAIIYYECRRELFLRGKRSRLRALDILAGRWSFLDIHRETLDIASELWARARKEGRQTAGDKSLDIDCMLAAQAIEAGAVVATGNVSHLGVYCDAEPWSTI